MLNYGRKLLAGSVVAASVAMFGLVGQTQATVVNPGSTVSSIATAVAPTSVLAGTHSGNYSLTNLANQVKGTGSYVVNVYSPDSDNGGLTTITVQVTVSSGDIGRLTLTDFSGYTTDVYYVSGSGTVQANDAGRNGATIADADQVYFDFSGFTSGSSVEYVIRTNAPDYTSGFLNLIDSGTDNKASFSPTTLPLPGVAWMGMALLTAIGGVKGMKRFRQSEMA